MTKTIDKAKQSNKVERIIPRSGQIVDHIECISKWEEKVNGWKDEFQNSKKAVAI